MNRHSQKLPLDQFLPEIWRRFTAGDERSFKKLFYTFHADMCRYGARICLDEELTRDCIQEIFLRLWLGREKLPEVIQVKAYLFKALRNDLLKRRQEKHRIGVQSLSPPTGGEPQITFSPEDVITQSEALHIKHVALSKALNKLPSREREVIWLRYYEELGYREIAAVMEIGYQSVMNYIYQGFQRLRKDPQLKRAAETSILFMLFKSV